MSMYSRILVPVDGSSFSRQILPLVSAIVQKTGAKVTLYQALEKSQAQAEAERELKAVAAPIGAEVVVAPAQDDVTRAILAEANKVPGTLVVMTSHGRSGVRRAILGSTALNILRVGGSPILVYRPEDQENDAIAKKIQHIVIPLDGSPLSESIIPQAAELARWLDARPVIVSVIDPVASREAGIAIGDVMESNYVQARAHRIREQHGLDVGWEVLHGKPEEAIPSFVRNVPGAMLAMTTHGRTALQSALMGSVTAAALREGGVPIFTRLP